MPVYNVEKYLEKSINGLLSQTFGDFELLLIDDKSPDKSGEICDKYARIDNRIKVFHLEENGGVSKARNYGISVAEGEYIIFLDSDDFIEENLLRIAVASMEENPADAVVFGLIEEYFDKNGRLYKTNKITLDSKVLKSKSEVREAIMSLEKSTLYGYPWNKLFRLEKLKQSGAQFPVMAFNEDIIFNIDFFSFAESLNILSIAPYHYAKRSGSTTGKFIPTYYQDIMLKIDKMYSQFENFDMLSVDNLKVISALYVRYFFSALARSFDKRSGFNRTARKSFFESELKTERYKNLRSTMRNSDFNGIMANCFKKGLYIPCCFIAITIFFIKSLFPKLYEKMK